MCCIRAKVLRYFGCLLMLACFGSLGLGPSQAEDFGVRTTQAAFEDVRFELGNAIVARGLSVHSEGNFGRMLERTGADVGSTKDVFRQAEFVTVCSAKLSRQLVEADPALMSACPFVLYLYERADQVGLVTVGFRRLPLMTLPGTAFAIAAVETMLDGIVRDAVK
jgi:uncharacterized protein (DUF302 family)